VTLSRRGSVTPGSLSVLSESILAITLGPFRVGPFPVDSFLVQNRVATRIPGLVFQLRLGWRLQSSRAGRLGRVCVNRLICQKEERVADSAPRGGWVFGCVGVSVPFHSENALRTPAVCQCEQACIVQAPTRRYQPFFYTTWDLGCRCGSSRTARYRKAEPRSRRAVVLPRRA
jgi:hypothetical protein